MEIVRKYLVGELPAEVEDLEPVLEQQGYLAGDGAREVRVNKSGDAFFLSVRDGKGTARLETEIPITSEQFDEMWALTKGCRVEKLRRSIFWEGRRVELDVYEFPLHPLIVAEIEFFSEEDSGRFLPPDFCGTEITGRHDYRSSWMARHGLPHEGATEYQVGALPYFFKGGELHLVLVTNASQSRWILPKGHPEKGMTRQEVAVMETIEEAGVIGAVSPEAPTGFPMSRNKVLYLYPLRVISVLKKWPEGSFRKRQILPASKALALLSDPDLARCVEGVLPFLKE